MGTAYSSPHRPQQPYHAAASASPISQNHPASSWRSARASDAAPRCGEFAGLGAGGRSGLVGRSRGARAGWGQRYFG